MEHGRSRRSARFARELRQQMTEAESHLWHHLRRRNLGGHKFRRQHPMGSFIVDFVCIETRVVIELDGGQHADQAAYDRKRDAWLRQQGYSVIRFWNHEVLGETEAVLEAIWNELSPGGRANSADRP